MDAFSGVTDKSGGRSYEKGLLKMVYGVYQSGIHLEAAALPCLSRTRNYLLSRNGLVFKSAYCLMLFLHGLISIHQLGFSSHFILPNFIVSAHPSFASNSAESKYLPKYLVKTHSEFGRTSLLIYRARYAFSQSSLQD